MNFEEYIHILKISEPEQIFEDPQDEIKNIYRQCIEEEDDYFKKLEEGSQNGY